MSETTDALEQPHPATSTTSTPAPAARRQSWRTVLAVRQPRRVAVIVLAVAVATYGYVFTLLVAFDARSWWGHSLGGIALAYGVMFAVMAALLRRRATNHARLTGFLFAGWAGVVLVSWLPRQPPQWPELPRLGWWTGWAIAIYVLIPTAYALIMRQRIRDYGLHLGLFRGELGIFAILLPVIAVGAYLAAGEPRFQATYPYYGGWPGGDGTAGHLLVWWGMYAASFVALEFFLRGFLVSAGSRLVGWWAVPAMAAPYCLLHLDKPVPEMLTSLIGGMLLGAVALRTGSILAGVLSHVTLAIGTDVAVLLRRA